MASLCVQVAGLPPVTKEWFEARKTQLSSAAAAAPNQRMWYDPLTKRKFQTQNTYLVGVVTNLAVLLRVPAWLRTQLFWAAWHIGHVTEVMLQFWVVGV